MKSKANAIDALKELGIGITIEWLRCGSIGLIRGGRGFVWGGTYELTAVVLWDGEVAEIKGYLGYYDRDVRRVMSKLFKSLGMEDVRYERMNTETRREKRIEV